MSASCPLSHNAASAPCAVCGEAGRPCARCRVHYYCGKAHQRQHWPLHRAGCGSVELRGSLIVATRDIPAGTVVIREQPLLTYPASLMTFCMNKSVTLLCMSCCADLSKKKPPCQCHGCGMPVCGAACSQSSDHQVECQVFQRAKFRLPKAHLEGMTGVRLGTIVATVRMAVAFPDSPLLQHLKRGLAADELSSKSRPLTFYDNMHLQVIGFVVHYLREIVGVKWLSKEDLNRAAHIVTYVGNVSGTTERLGAETKQFYLGAVFLGTSMRKQSCCPNSSQRVMTPETRELVVVTTRNVAAGECVTMQRQGCHWTEDTLQRRESISVRWGIVCDCDRCSDPTELGMYVGSPCCPDCAGQGKQCYLVPRGDARKDWRCEGCLKKVTAPRVKALTKSASYRLNELLGSAPEKLFKFIEDHVYPRGLLHQTHTLVLRAKDSIRDGILNINSTRGHGAVCAAGELGELDRYVELIRGQVRSLDRLLPGISDPRCMMLHALRWLLIHRLESAIRSSQDEDERIMAEETNRKISQLKDAILDVNRDLCRHFFTRDEDEPKRSLIREPFVM